MERSRGCRRDVLLKTIHRYLERPPEPKPKPNPHCHLIIDGTWFGKDYCLLVYWDVDLKYVQWWRYGTGEKVLEILDDLRGLKEAGVVCASITSDGAPGIVGAVGMEYPNIPHQRCVTHLQRQALAFITRYPRTIAGKKIKPLVQWASKIDNYGLRDGWVKRFDYWCVASEEFLKERSWSDDGSQSWYTHKQLRRARALIKNALPDLFHYLDDPTIPKTSNGLEGRFGGLKQHYGQHRGLCEGRREGYIAWYLRMVVNRDSPTRNQY